jgi:hypothetical protein
VKKDNNEIKVVGIDGTPKTSYSSKDSVTGSHSKDITSIGSTAK